MCSPRVTSLGISAELYLEAEFYLGKGRSCMLGGGVNVSLSASFVIIRSVNYTSMLIGLAFDPKC